MIEILIALAHIAPVVAGYALYIASSWLFLRQRGGHEKFLKMGNIIYGFGLLFGSLWAQLAWGSFILSDSKYYISFLIFFVFLYAWLYGGARKKYWMILGVSLILMNLILPKVIGTIHHYL